MNPPSRVLHATLLATTLGVVAWAWMVLKPEPSVPPVVTWLDLSAAYVKADAYDGERPHAVSWPGDASALTGTVSIVGRVVDVHGEPVRDARVTVTDARGSNSETFAEVDGRFAFAGIAAGDVTLDVVSRRAGAVSTTRHADAGQRLRWDPILDASRCVAGTLLDLRRGDVRPGVGERVTLRAADGSEHVVTTDDRGRFTWLAPSTAPVSLAVAGDRHVVASVADVAAIVPGGDEVVLALVDGEPGRVLGSVTLEGRPPLRPVTVIARHVASGLTRRVESTGRFAVEGLPPGDVAVDVEVFDKLVHQGEPRDVPPGRAVAVGEIAVAPMGRLVIARDGPLLDDSTTIELRGATGRTLDWQDMTPRQRDVELALAPGRYTLRVSSRGRPLWSQDVTVTSETVTTSHLRAPDDAG